MGAARQNRDRIGRFAESPKGTVDAGQVRALAAQAADSAGADAQDARNSDRRARIAALPAGQRVVVQDGNGVPREGVLVAYDGHEQVRVRRDDAGPFTPDVVAPTWLVDVIESQPDDEGAR